MNSNYINPTGKGKGYFKRKMRYLKKHNPKFVCIQRLDMASAEDRAAIEEWLKGVLNITLPTGTGGSADTHADKR